MKEHIASTRKERIVSADNNRRTLSKIVAVSGAFLSPYLGTILLRSLLAVFKSHLDWLDFNFIRNWLVPFRAILGLKNGDPLETMGYAVLIGWAFFSMATFVIVFNINWRTDRIKKFSRKNSDVGTPDVGGSGEHGTARWQTETERDNTTKVWDTSESITRGGLVVGSKIIQDKRGNETEIFNIIDGNEHAVMWATTRIGKTRKEVLPLIWTCAQAGESMVINDPKGELYVSSGDYLKEKGYNVICINFREPLKGSHWNLLWLVNRFIDLSREEKKEVKKYKEFLKDNGEEDNPDLYPMEIRMKMTASEGYIAKAVEVAGDISYAITNSDSDGGKGEKIWKNGEQSVLQALILAVSMEGGENNKLGIDNRHMTSVYRLLAKYGVVDEDGEIPLNNYFDTLGDLHPATLAYAPARLAHEKTRTSFFVQLLTTLRLFADPEIQDMTASIDHDMYEFGTKKTAVFMVVPDDKKNRNVLASIYADQAYVSCVTVANKFGGVLPIRVRFIFDEFGNMPAISDFDSKMTVAGGRGILFVLILQNLTQLEANYEKHADTIIGNCHTWLYLGSQEPKVTELISKQAGVYTIEVDGFNANFEKSQTTSSGSNLSLTQRPLLTTDEVLMWDKNYVLVLRLGHYPARFPLGDISLFKANTDYGFYSLDKNVEVVNNLAKGDISEFNLTSYGASLFYDLINVVKNEMNHYSKFDYATKGSQFVTIAKWDSIPLRTISRLSVFDINSRFPSTYSDDGGNPVKEVKTFNSFGKANNTNVVEESDSEELDKELEQKDEDNVPKHLREQLEPTDDVKKDEDVSPLDDFSVADGDIDFD